MTPLPESARLNDPEDMNGIAITLVAFVNRHDAMREHGTSYSSRATKEFHAAVEAEAAASTALFDAIRKALAAAEAAGVKREREACAQECDRLQRELDSNDLLSVGKDADDCARHIRARPQPEEPK